MSVTMPGEQPAGPNRRPTGPSLRGVGEVLDGRRLGQGVLALLVLAWVWVLLTGPLTWAAALLAALVGGVLILIRPGLGLPLIALAIPFGAFQGLSLGSGAVGAQDVLLAAVVAAWILRGLAQRKLPIRWPGFAGAGALLLATMLLSFLPATALRPALKELVKWGELWLAAVLVLNLCDRTDIMLLVGGLLLAGAAQGLLGLYQFVAGVGPAAFTLMGRFMRASGSFDQPNPFGGYLGLLLPLAVGLLLTAWPGRDDEPRVRRRKMLIWLYAAVTGALIAGGLLASWSRGAWLGAAVALVVVLVARGGLWLRGALMAIAVVVLVSLAVLGRVPVPDALRERVVDFAADFTTFDVRNIEVTDANFAVVERAAHWQAAWGMFSDHPWTGVGLGNYAQVYPKYALPRWQDPLGHAHNYYLNMAAEAGLPGLVAYLLWVVAGFWIAVRAVRVSRGVALGIALGVLGMIVHLSVHNLVDDLYVHGMPIQIGLMLGLAAWLVAGK